MAGDENDGRMFGSGKTLLQLQTVQARKIHIEEKTGDGIGFFRSHILASRIRTPCWRFPWSRTDPRRQFAHSRIIIHDENYLINRHRNFLSSGRAASINHDRAHTVPPGVGLRKVSSLGFFNPRRATSPKIQKTEAILLSWSQCACVVRSALVV